MELYNNTTTQYSNSKCHLKWKYMFKNKKVKHRTNTPGCGCKVMLT